MPNKSKVIYAGTFDPITYGHIDIVARAAQLFDEVIVAVASDTKKNVLFNANERIELAQVTLRKYANVSVRGFSGLLVNFAREMNVFTILRGLRAVTDFEYEFQLANINRKMESHMETVFLTPAEQYSYISSSMVREIAELGGDVSAFVPEEVLEKLREKFAI